MVNKLPWKFFQTVFWTDFKLKVPHLRHTPMWENLVVTPINYLHMCVCTTEYCKNQMLPVYKISFILFIYVLPLKPFYWSCYCMSRSPSTIKSISLQTLNYFFNRKKTCFNTMTFVKPQQNDLFCTDNRKLSCA